MLYHYAITPDAFDRPAIVGTRGESLILIELLWGIAQNGLLANLENGTWLTHVRRLVQETSADIRDQVERCLVLLYDRHRLVCHPRGTPRDETEVCRWLHWALERHLSDPGCVFKGVFTTDEYLRMFQARDSVFVPLHEALHAPCWRNRPCSIRFQKTEKQLRQHLAPLVRYAHKVTLIDPYMTCRKAQFFNTVQRCADLLGKQDNQRTPGQILIHAGDPEKDSHDSHRESAGSRLDRWERELRPVANHFGHSFRVVLWKNRSGGSKFHDRYIITDQCGVDARGGLDFMDDHTKANWSGWSWLEPEDIRAIVHREFHPATSPYQYLDSRQIKP